MTSPALSPLRRPFTLPLAALLLGLLALPSDPLPAEELRTWTSVDGRRIEARFIEFDPVSGKVSLQLGNDREIRYPLTHLSDEDRRWIGAGAGHAPAASLSGFFAPEAPDREGTSALALRWHAMKESLDDDATFVAWIYDQLLGRPPTQEEFDRFAADETADRRMTLIDSLMATPEHDEHFVDAFLAELLQIDGRMPEDLPFSDCPEPTAEHFDRRLASSDPGAYRRWVVEQVRTDRPWTELVTELLTATGRYPETPALGYLLFDAGLEVIDAARVMTSFTGVEMTCARCHDHPWTEVYQMDYFKLAACFAELEFELGVTGEGLVAVAASDDPGKRVRLPADYKYVDGEPGMVVAASTYFGERIDPAPGQALRESFADWLTAPSNPRFTRNIANRLWKHVFGLAPVEPANHLPGHLGDSGGDPELLDHLAELLVEHDYRLKEFLKLLYASAPF